MKIPKQKKKNKNKSENSINDASNSDKKDNKENNNKINNPLTKLKNKIEEKKSKQKSEIAQLEEKFKKKLQKYNYILHIVPSDGNCLFSSVSDQVYGTDKHNLLIREKCMDYIEKNSIFYSRYIEGGETQMPAYIKRKRKSGIWGDNMEIQALSEIYKRPIEIYINPDKPITSYSNIRHDKKKFPIKISFHGNKHYNSIVPSIKSIEFESFKKELINSKPGIYEDEFIKKFDPSIKLKDMYENNKGNNNIDLEALFQDNISKDEEFLINEAIENSKMNININNEEDLKEEDEEKYLENPIIQSTLEFGFDLAEAIEALKICGNNQELVLNYLYDKK